MAQYKVLLYSTNPASSGGFGPLALIADFDNVKNIGWEKHLNEVGSAFFTINQDDPKLSGIRAHKGLAHVKIIRDNETVWSGIWGEHDAQGEDVVFYAYGYEGLLYSLITDWNQQWEDATVGTIISDLWTYAKTTLTYSPVGFVTTGTLQSPVTTSGGATAITLPSYKVYHKRILHSFKELMALSISDTTNTVYFEMAPSATPATHTVTFNVWKNKSTDQADVLLEYPNGKVRDFTDAQLPVLTRNDLAVVGSAPNDILLRGSQTQASGAQGYEAFGRRQEPLFFAWVRDETELDRVGKLRLARAVRAEPDIRLQLLADSLKPPGATGAGYALGDRIKVKLQRGITAVDQYMFVSGVQVISLRGREHISAYLMDRGGS